MAGSSEKQSPRVTIDQKYKYLAEYLARLGRDWTSSDSIGCLGDDDLDLDYSRLVE